MTKGELRSKYLKLRSELSKEQAEQMSVEIYDALVGEFDLENKHVSVFLPISKFGEINTKPLLNLNNTYVLPVVDAPNNMLKHVIYEGDHQLKVTGWGIPEPTFGSECSPEKLDFVLVPLLAYDRLGYRVGYGKGYYDRFLSNCNKDCVFIGLSFFEPEEQILDVHDDDVRLHYCVTPEKIHRFE